MLGARAIKTFQGSGGFDQGEPQASPKEVDTPHNGVCKGTAFTEEWKHDTNKHKHNAKELYWPFLLCSLRNIESVLAAKHSVLIEILITLQLRAGMLIFDLPRVLIDVCSAECNCIFDLPDHHWMEQQFKMELQVLI